MLVGVGERPGHVAEQAHRLGERERAPGEPRAERLALDVGHGVVGQPVALARREQRDDVRVGEPRGEADLLAEALAAHRVGQLGRQDLDDHLPAERGLLGQVDAGHAAAAELALDGVGGAEGALERGAEVGDGLGPCLESGKSSYNLASRPDLRST